MPDFHNWPHVQVQVRISLKALIHLLSTAHTMTMIVRVPYQQSSVACHDSSPSRILVFHLAVDLCKIVTATAGHTWQHVHSYLLSCDYTSVRHDHSLV